jgi:hypothetical protein
VSQEGSHLQLSGNANRKSPKGLESRLLGEWTRISHRLGAQDSTNGGRIMWDECTAVNKIKVPFNWAITRLRSLQGFSRFQQPARANASEPKTTKLACWDCAELKSQHTFGLQKVYSGFEFTSLRHAVSTAEKLWTFGPEMCEKVRTFRDICYTNRTREKAPAGALYFRSGAFLQGAYWKSAFEDFKRRTFSDHNPDTMRRLT